MWLLESDGRLLPLTETLDSSGGTCIEFATTGDGRGFSYARQHKFNRRDQRLLARGALIPDQVAMAFAVGFDAIVLSAPQLDFYGRTAWLDAAGRYQQQADYPDTIWRSRAQTGNKKEI